MPTDLVNEGERLIESCKKHLLRTMRTLPDCQPRQRGAGSHEIEQAAGFGLALTRQDNWLTWSLLQRMGRDGVIDIVRAGRARYRLNE
jgi:hypothetical protein